jgi:hypothetical protein
VAEGIFNIANNVISVVSSPNISGDMLRAFEARVGEAYVNKTPQSILADEVEKIDPSFGLLVRNAPTTNAFLLTVLLMILACIKSCNVSVKLDANQLIDQMVGVKPSAIALEKK